VSTSHLLHIFIPSGEIEKTIRDYIHNLIVNTDLRRLGPMAIEQLQYFNLGKLIVDGSENTNPASAGLPSPWDPKSKEVVSKALNAYIQKEGTSPRTPASPGTSLAANITTIGDLLV